MGRALVYLVPVAMTIYGIVDLARSETVERAGLKRWVWLLIVLVPVLGTVTWLVVSRSHRVHVPPAPSDRRSGDRRSSVGPTARPWDRRRGPVAPDDDPEFLWRLAQQQRRARRDPDGHRRRTTDGEGPGAPDQSPDADGGPPGDA